MMNDFSLAERFESHRPQLRSVAYRMLGSTSEADDAVQEAWLRLSRSDTSEVENLAAWLTTVVGRVCLDTLRSRKSRGEEPLGVHVPDPIVSLDPEQETLMADSIGLALLVVLETLSPAERLSFVLHDMFGVPFDDIATIAGRTPAATRQLASRARRRVQGVPAPETDLTRQRTVVEAFIAASRGGDFDALVAVLDPDVVLHVDGGTFSKLIRGAAEVAGQSLMFSRHAPHSRPALINGAWGILTAPDGKPASVMAFTVRGGLVAELHILADPERLGRLEVKGS